MKRYILIIAILFYASMVMAQPDISSITGAVIHGQSITIAGGSFGLKSPAAPVLWDDCSTDLALSDKYDGYKPKTAQQGSSYNIAYRPVGFRGVDGPNSRVNYFIGGAHAIDRDADSDEFGGNVCIGKNISSHSYFISYYYRLDPLFDDENHPTRSDNLKEFVLSNTEGQFYPDGERTFGYAAWCSDKVPDKNYTSGTRLSRIPINPANHDRPYDCDDDIYVVFHNNPVNNWTKMQWEGEYNSVFDSPQIKLTTYPDGSITSQSHYGDGLTVHEYFRGSWIGYPKENDLRFIGIGGFARIPRENNGINSFRYFCSVYMDNTHARVMIGNNAIYDDCTILEPQPPTAWSDTSISVTINQGSLALCQSAYVYIFDSEGNISDQDPGMLGIQGFPVLIASGSGESPCPPQKRTQDDSIVQ
jgi:hypothetical protein